MRSSKVSVIIPAYNQAHFLEKTIQSVLDQTYENIEIIVVNDASTDHTKEVFNRFDDPRLKYLEHQENRHLAAARNTGIKASSGEFIACLDADDLFHPQKIEKHVTFLEQNLSIGGTYNSRFEIDPTGNLLGLWEAPSKVTLADFVLGFPFSPSDMVVRRDWLFRVNLYDESFVMFSEDIDITCRLALAGCTFAMVGGNLNYRRRHPGRTIRNVSGRLEAAVRALEKTFSDTRCPADVIALREQALGKTYLIWSFWALVQNETKLGQKFAQEGVKYDPTYLDNEAQRYLELMLSLSILNDDKHEILLEQLFDQLPLKLSWLAKYRNPLVACGYLKRGVREIMWGRITQGEQHLANAALMGVQVDQDFFQNLTYQLLIYEKEFGSKAALKLLQQMTRHLEKVVTRTDLRNLNSSYFIDQSYRDYRDGQYHRVVFNVLRAIKYDRSYLADRGVLSILSRSFLRSPFQLLKA